MNPTQTVLRDTSSLSLLRTPWGKLLKKPAMAKHCAAKRALLAVVFALWAETFQTVAAVLIFFRATYRVVEKMRFKIFKTENTLVKWNLCWWRTAIRCDIVNQWPTCTSVEIHQWMLESHDFGPDGVIYWTFPGCQIFSPTVVRVLDILDAKGMEILVGEKNQFLFEGQRDIHLSQAYLSSCAFTPPSSSRKLRLPVRTPWVM